jgi:hypothetical protein
MMDRRVHTRIERSYTQTCEVFETSQVFIMEQSVIVVAR